MIEAIKLRSKAVPYTILSSAGIRPSARVLSKHGMWWFRHESIGGDILAAMLSAATVTPKEGQEPPFAPELCLQKHTQTRLRPPPGGGGGDAGDTGSGTVPPSSGAGEGGETWSERYSAGVERGSWRYVQTTKTHVGFPAFLARRALGPLARDKTSDGAAMPADASLAAGVKLMKRPWRPQVQARLAAMRYFAQEADRGAASCRLVLGCGAGKTLLMIAIAVAMGRRTIIFSHDTTIQAGIEVEANRFTRGLRIGLIRESRWDVDDSFDLVIASVQTITTSVARLGMAKTRKRIRSQSFGLCIFDEAHRFATAGWADVRTVVNSKFCLSVTATPERDDGLVHELEAHQGPVVLRGRERVGHCAVVCARWMGLADWMAPAVSEKQAYALASQRGGHSLERVREALRSGDTSSLSRDYNRILRQVALDRGRNDVLCDLVAHMVSLGRNVLVFSLRAGVHLPILCRGILDRLTKLPVDALPPRRVAAAPNERYWSPEQKRAFRKTGARPAELAAPLVGCMYGKVPKKKEETADQAEMRVFADRAKDELLAAYPDDSDLILQLLGSKSAISKWRQQVLLMATVVVATVDKFKEGINCPWMDAAVFAMARPGEAVTTQSMDRVTRVLDGKAFPVVFDFGDALGNTNLLLRQQDQRRALYRKRQLPCMTIPLSTSDRMTHTRVRGILAAAERAPVERQDRKRQRRAAGAPQASVMAGAGAAGGGGGREGDSENGLEADDEMMAVMERQLMRKSKSAVGAIRRTES